MVTCAEKGRWLGKAPFGYRNTVVTVDGVAIRKNISVHLIEAEMVRKIFNLVNLSFYWRFIVNHLFYLLVFLFGALEMPRVLEYFGPDQPILIVVRISLNFGHNLRDRLTEHIQFH